MAADSVPSVSLTIAQMLLAVQLWDAIAVLALVFTATIVPVDVAFIPPGEGSFTSQMDDPIFVCNRVVDAVFALDLVLQFFLM